MNPSSEDTSPAGSGPFQIGEGDCLMSVAAEHGFYWETLWNHPEMPPFAKSDEIRWFYFRETG